MLKTPINSPWFLFPWSPPRPLKPPTGERRSWWRKWLFERLGCKRLSRHWFDWPPPKLFGPPLIRRNVDFANMEFAARTSSRQTGNFKIKAACQFHRSDRNGLEIDLLGGPFSRKVQQRVQDPLFLFVPAMDVVVFWFLFSSLLLWWNAAVQAGFVAVPIRAFNEPLTRIRMFHHRRGVKSSSGGEERKECENANRVCGRK